jgi:hypothetical protein
VAEACEVGDKHVGGRASALFVMGRLHWHSGPSFAGVSLIVK